MKFSVYGRVLGRLHFKESLWRCEWLAPKPNIKLRSPTRHNNTKHKNTPIKAANKTMSSNIYGKEMFTVVPIEGMQSVQKNFVKYQNSEETIRQLFGSKKAVPLCKRFQLVERGYAMLLKDDDGKENSGKESLTSKIGDKKIEEVVQKAQPLSQKNH